jgi:hypothetical protein
LSPHPCGASLSADALVKRTAETLLLKEAWIDARLDLLLFPLHRFGHQAGRGRKPALHHYGKNHFGKAVRRMSMRCQKPHRPLMPCRRPPGGGKSDDKKRNHAKNRPFGIWNAEQKGAIMTTKRLIEVFSTD